MPPPVCRDQRLSTGTPGMSFDVRIVSDVLTLATEGAGHYRDVVCEIHAPSRYGWDLSLAAQFSFGTDFAGHAGDFARERVKLVHHRIDGVLEFENFALHIDRDLA